MSFKSKRTITSMAASLVLLTGYAIFVMGKHSPMQGEIKSWAIATFIFIGISIAVQVAIQILFHIAMSVGFAIKENEEDDAKIERFISTSSYEDEMDKLIKLKSMRVYVVITGIGAVAALASLAFGFYTLTALYIIFGSIAVGTFIEGATSVYLYERGVRNG